MKTLITIDYEDRSLRMMDSRDLLLVDYQKASGALYKCIYLIPDRCSLRYA